MSLVLSCPVSLVCFVSFFFNDTATTEIYTLSLHDALPIWRSPSSAAVVRSVSPTPRCMRSRDRKSTRLNSSHLVISYAVFCLKKKNDGSMLLEHHDLRHYRVVYFDKKINFLFRHDQCMPNRPWIVFFF